MTDSLFIQRIRAGWWRHSDLDISSIDWRKLATWKCCNARGVDGTLFRLSITAHKDIDQLTEEDITVEMLPRSFGSHE